MFRLYVLKMNLNRLNGEAANDIYFNANNGNPYCTINPRYKMIFTLHCAECNLVLAYSYTNLPKQDSALCYICMDNFCNMAEVFGANLPNRLDLLEVENSLPNSVQYEQRKNVLKTILYLRENESLTNKENCVRMLETFTQEIDKC